MLKNSKTHLLSLLMVTIQLMQMKNAKFSYTAEVVQMWFILKIPGHWQSPNLGICCKTYFS